MTSQSTSETPSMTRWYIDTRPLTATTISLPLLETLQLADQETVKKYYHLADRHMSLASYLLKYLFIHRTCRIPWSEVTISRTPEPHRRPCFVPSPSRSSGKDGRSIPNVEFNVSHQASLVALAGCIIPSSSSLSTATAIFSHPSPSSAPTQSIPQIGIDITCVDEPSRRGRKDSVPTTRKQLADFVDIFAEVFSRRELDAIKPVPASSSSSSSTTQQGSATVGGKEEEAVRSRLRLFYTYWALKEAYIKMTGEALLAPWLRELEFTDVVAPEPVDPLSTNTATGGDGGAEREQDNDSAVWGTPYTGTQTWLRGKRVEDVRIEVVAFERDYLVATAARGGGLGAGSRPDDARGAGQGRDRDPWGEFKKIEIERDVAPCARGECRCLS
ncbi:4'-phosphopantetheinyl transferase NpgA [Thermoascus aurantiacus ATCC 26904]